MKVLKFFLLCAGILLLSAVLAPLLFDFLPFKFERIFNRLVMIFSLAAVLFFVRIRKQTFIDYGLEWKGESFLLLLACFMSGAAMLLFLDLIKIALGVAEWRPAEIALRVWGARLFQALGAALLIGFIEEFFFRGFIFYSLNKKMALNTAVSVILTSLFYSSVHFVDHKTPFIGHDPTLLDSLKLIWAPFESLRHFGQIWPGFLGLFIFGVILSGIFLRTKSLYGPIGLHAGSVFFLKLDGLWFDFLNHKSLFWGSSTTYDGILSWIFFGVFYFIFRKAEQRGGWSRKGAMAIVL